MENITVALISFLGTLAGSVAGVLASNKLTAYRLTKLEEKVDKHNNLVERMALVEQCLRTQHNVEKHE